MDHKLESLNGTVHDLGGSVSEMRQDNLDTNAKIDKNYAELKAELLEFKQEVKANDTVMNDKIKEKRDCGSSAASTSASATSPRSRLLRKCAYAGDPGDGVLQPKRSHVIV